MINYHLDYETRSKADLKKVGPYKYAEHESTRILFAAVSREDGPTYLWINPEFETPLFSSDPEAIVILREMAHPDALVWAHNAEFERAISRARMLLDIGVVPPQVHQWRCTAAICRKASLPASLDEISAVLRLKHQKDKRGTKLINKFSKPKKDGSFNNPLDHLDDFIAFGDYCKTDVDAEKGVYHTLKPFELSGQNLRTFQLDAQINYRGLPVNVPALLTAQKIIDEVQTDLGMEFNLLTGLQSGQREAFRSWLLARGLNMVDMTMETLEWAMTQPLDELTMRAVQLYSELNYAAAKKVTSMLDCVCDDGRVRGTLLYYGASTGRWAGRLIQPQNFKRPTIKDTDLAYQMICDGCSREDLALLFGNPLEVIASCIRHFIHWQEGDMLDADYNAVEARIVCWLAGQDDVLEDFRNGVDIYKKMASDIYQVPVESIQNPSKERTVGKHTILGCGFQMWYPRFKETCENFGVSVSEELAKKAVLAYRERCWKVEKLWHAAEAAAINAIGNPGKIYKAGELMKFAVVEACGIPFLVSILPSKRSLVYPWPKLEFDQKFEKNGITFYGRMEAGTGMGLTQWGPHGAKARAKWGRVRTYGGKLVENATQGVAADIMAYGSCEAMDRGFDIFALIHDQALAPRYEGQTPEDFCKALTTLPAWAMGLPIKAEGKVVPYYKK